MTLYLCAMSLLKDKLAAVRKNIHVEPRNETLLWTMAGTRAAAITAEGMMFGSLPPRHSSMVTKPAFTSHSAPGIFLTL